MKLQLPVWAGLCLFVGAAPAAAARDQQAALAEQPATAPAAPVIPMLTRVELALDQDMGSAISRTGDTFSFHLARPIVVDGKIAVAAGAPGMGEVIHAKHAGGSGAAGELVLAARYLDVGERHLKLRSLRYAVAGKDAIKAVDSINAASAASPIPIGVIGYFITGRNIVLGKGAVVVARTAEDFVVGAAQAGSGDGGGPATGVQQETDGK